MAGFKNIVKKVVIIQGGGSSVANEKLSYDLPEKVPAPSPKDSLAALTRESVRAQSEISSAAYLIQAAEVIPTQTEAIRITASIILNNEAVPITKDAPAPVISVVDSIQLINLVQQVQSTLNGYANENVATTTWATPANALGNTTGAAATLGAISSGVAGTTNTTATGSMTLGFQDINLGELNLTSVILNVENSGVIAGVAVAAATTNIVWAYSLNNGASFTPFYTMNVPSTAKGIRPVDITAIIGQNQSLLGALQIRASGTITSGTGVNVGNTVSFFRAWMNVLSNRTY